MATVEQLKDLRSATYEHRDAEDLHIKAMDKLTAARAALNLAEENVAVTKERLEKAQRKLEQAASAVAGGIVQEVR